MNTGFLLLEQCYLACPMCLSGATGKSLLAANSAILLMLVVLAAVLGSFVGFIVCLARRARRVSSETPGSENP